MQGHAQRAEAIVKATTFYDDADVIAKVSRGLGEAMVGINVDDIPEPHRLGRASVLFRKALTINTRPINLAWITWVAVDESYQ